MRHNTKTPDAATQGADDQLQQQKRRRAGLPDEVWDKILGSVDDNSVIAFACVSKQLRRVQQTSGRRLKTDLQQYEDDNNIYYSFCLYETRKFSAVSETWCLWSMSSLTVKLVWENAIEKPQHPETFITISPIYEHAKNGEKYIYIFSQKKKIS